MKYKIILITTLVTTASAVAVAQNPNNSSQLSLKALNEATTLITLDKLKAFPTAEGAGANATGGRYGKVIYVKNRNASGPESLKEALETEGKRTVVFAVGGRFNINDGIALGNWTRNADRSVTYHNQDKYNDLTFAGQTANDKGGLHLTNTGETNRGERSFSIQKQKNIVLRYFDARYNWQWWLPENGNQQIPTLRIADTSDLIIDHISSGWSGYGLIVTNARGTNLDETGKVTVQRSLMHENVMTPQSSPGNHNHNIGMLLGIRGHNNNINDWNKVTSFSIHKNAFIGLSHRFPNTAGGELANFNVVNNFIYGFTGDNDMRLSRIAGNSWNDFINNSYQEAKYSKKFATNNLLGFQFGSFMAEPGMPDTKPNFYIDGNLFIDEQENVLDITKDIKDDPRKMTFVYATSPSSTTHNRGPNLNERDHGLILRPYSVNERVPDVFDDLDNIPAPEKYPVSILPANQVKSAVLSNVGGNVRFNSDGSTYIDDPVDQNYINWAVNNTGPENTTVALNDGGIGDMGGQNTEHGEFRFKYPEYTSRSVILDDYDYDKDGMPDTWEKEHKLTPKSPDGSSENNEVRKNRDWLFGKYLVRNTAGYTNLEMYLADIAGDFHVLAKTEGKPINDELISVSMPQAVNAGTTVIANVKYSAKTDRQVKCFFRKESRPRTVYAVSKPRVSAGTGTAQCKLEIPANIPTQGEYRLYTYLTDTTGKWSKRFDEVTKIDIKVAR